MDAVERLISYLKVDTRSVPDQEKIPSSEKQFKLARILEKELKELGVSDVRLDEHCYVYGRILSNLSGEAKEKTPAIGFSSHMDTSPSASGENVQPRIVKNYDGKEIRLNEEEQLSPKVFPRLLEQVGDDLMVTDGRTLLGADDKISFFALSSCVTEKPSLPGSIRSRIRRSYSVESARCKPFSPSFSISTEKPESSR